MPPIIMRRGLIDLSTRTPLSIARLSASAPSSHDLSLAAFTISMAESSFRHTQGHPLPDGPWIFSRSTLGEPAAQRLVHRARQNPNHPTGSHPDQQNLFSPIT